MAQEKKYFTFNNKGDTGVTDATYERAMQDLEYNRDHYPDEDWQLAEQDDYSSGV